MANLRHPILATLAYYGLFDFPLTLAEVHAYLVNPGRLARITEGIGEISLGEVMEELDGLARIGVAHEYNGFYCTADRAHELYEKRIAREKIADHKWKKLLRIARWFQAVPYLEGMFVSGSLALGNSAPHSDFDVLTITRSDRLYTCRVLLSIVASLFRARRTRHDKVAPDKFCFNHYITDRSLEIPFQSLYNAQTYAALRPALNRGDVCGQFFAKNSWIKKYCYNFQPDVPTRRMVKPSFLITMGARMGEMVLDTFIGDGIERWLKAHQQNRIRSNPVTYESGGRTVFTDDQLEFHPHSAEAMILARYNMALRQLGIIPQQEEVDSGLVGSLDLKESFA